MSGSKNKETRRANGTAEAPRLKIVVEPGVIVLEFSRRVDRFALTAEDYGRFMSKMEAAGRKLRELEQKGRP